MLESAGTGKKVEGCFGLGRLLASFPAEESHWFLGPTGALGNSFSRHLPALFIGEETTQKGKGPAQKAYFFIRKSCSE